MDLGSLTEATDGEAEYWSVAPEDFGHASLVPPQFRRGPMAFTVAYQLPEGNRSVALTWQPPDPIDSDPPEPFGVPRGWTANRPGQIVGGG